MGRGDGGVGRSDNVIAIAVTMTLATRRTEIRFIVTMPPPPISIERSALIGRLPS